MIVLVRSCEACGFVSQFGRPFTKLDDSGIRLRAVFARPLRMSPHGLTHLCGLYQPIRGTVPLAIFQRARVPPYLRVQLPPKRCLAARPTGAATYTTPARKAGNVTGSPGRWIFPSDDVFASFQDVLTVLLG